MGRERVKTGGGGLIAWTPRWVLLCGFWLVQGVVLWFVQAFLYTWSGTVDSPGGKFWGELPGFDSLTSTLTEWDFVVWMGWTLVIVTGAQAVFVWPVRMPGRSLGRGRAVRSSLVAAGCIIGFMVFAWVAAVVTFFEVVHPFGDLDWEVPGGEWTVFGLCMALGWGVSTPMLIVFSKPGRREDILSRLSRRILMGTVLEIALIIPLDVMVRRKESCYCGAGTYWSLTICGFVGVFALGPAVLCPLLAKRRKAWYGGHCGVCGYDMSGSSDSVRCPECGTGWRDEA